jgi:DNA-binding transcriptional regulator YhcF (GntR family)
MSLSKAITFRGYEILAKARLVTVDDWVGGYVVTKDNRIVRIRNTVVYRETADAAVDSALVYGVQFVDRCELRKS